MAIPADKGQRDFTPHTLLPRQLPESICALLRCLTMALVRTG